MERAGEHDLARLEAGLSVRPPRQPDSGPGTSKPQQLDAVSNPSVGASNNRITSAGYAYDASGGLVQDPAHTYGYDGEGVLTTVDGVHRGGAWLWTTRKPGITLTT